MAYKNYFRPNNKKKYIGDVDNIYCRSLWERRFCKYLDENENINKWGFEQIKIPYLLEADNQIHTYIPDFIIETKNKQITIIEIKPLKQTKAPQIKKNKKYSIQECLAYSMNSSKWESASKYCASKGWLFKILTEKDIF
jgi:hypothetical protein